MKRRAFLIDHNSDSVRGEKTHHKLRLTLTLWGQPNSSVTIGNQDYLLLVEHIARCHYLSMLLQLHIDCKQIVNFSTSTLFKYSDFQWFEIKFQ